MNADMCFIVESDYGWQFLLFSHSGKRYGASGKELFLSKSNNSYWWKIMFCFLFQIDYHYIFFPELEFAARKTKREVGSSGTTLGRVGLGCKIWRPLNATQGYLWARKGCSETIRTRYGLKSAPQIIQKLTFWRENSKFLISAEHASRDVSWIWRPIPSFSWVVPIFALRCSYLSGHPTFLRLAFCLSAIKEPNP